MSKKVELKWVPWSEGPDGYLEDSAGFEVGQGWWFGFDCAHAGDMRCDPNADITVLSPEALAIVAIERRHPIYSDHY